ncbi:hypothetical protein AADG42_01365 [Ammonicoccus fulvus]|uniref:ABC transporter permease n=1 Tax=Ammonicoccus fulvus TaxID=3138240 RepID=A0ABZ3FJ41_9ACTN
MSGKAFGLILSGTALAAAAGAVLGLDLPGYASRFAASSSTSQLLISVPGPFLGALLGCRHRRGNAGSDARLLARATGLAVGLAAAGLAASTAVVALTAAEPGPAHWGRAPEVAAGAVAVQVVAMLTGTGFGLLSGRPILASVLTIAAPMSVLFVLGAVAPDARAWLTPSPTAQRLVAGDWDRSILGPWLTVVALWGAALNVAGFSVARRSRP